MSFDAAIKIENLSKCYHIYDQPRDRLKQFVLPRFQKLIGQNNKQYFREFWALKNIHFDVKKGETVGIIGRNGSGKSTLLQMICGTLNPTAGEVQTHGRIAALLELGSGFNPEFTGRENIYMNGAVLGLTYEEIEKRFNDITNFAEIGDFIDQPVKTYSSGMMVRLAFAVIAHVDADILIIDEALAVGDAVFTQKCMRFIRKFKERGTLLFVSHDMGSVLNLCERAIWLNNGELCQQGTAKEVSETYLQFTLQAVYADEATLKTIPSDGALNAKSILEVGNSESNDKNEAIKINYGAEYKVSSNLSDANGWKTGAGEIIKVSLNPVSEIDSESTVLKGGETIDMEIQAIAHQDMDRPILGFLVRDRLGQDLFGENTLSFTNIKPMPVRMGECVSAKFRFVLPMLPNGDYSVMASLADGDLTNHVQHHWLHNALMIHVVSSQVRYGLVGINFQSIDFCKIS